MIQRAIKKGSTFSGRGKGKIGQNLRKRYRISQEAFRKAAAGINEYSVYVNKLGDKWCVNVLQ